MSLCSGNTRLGTADALLLLLLMTAQIYGYVTAIWSLPWIWKAAAMVAFDAVLLTWVASWKVPAQERGANLAFALKLQVQAAAQIVPGLYLSAAFLLAFHLVMGYFDSQSPWMRYINVDTMLKWHGIVLTFALLAAQLLGAARLHDLHRKGLRLADVAAGALNHADIPVPASAARVGNRLAFYLDKMTQAGAPSMNRLWYGRKPVIRQIQENGATVHTATWRDCPSQIRITVQPASADTSLDAMANASADASQGRTPGAATLRISCVLRGGFQRLDLCVNPHDALALMEFVQANVVQLITSEFALSDAAARQDALRLHTVEMQLRMLQAQIEPHFLFNTLANVRQLYRTDVHAGEAMMDHLIAYLRSAMDELRAGTSTVGREFALALHYLALMKIRMGERLSYRFIEADALAQHAFPPAMLISLVENAVMHGLHDKPDGVLTISATRDGGHLRVTVLDNGAGFSSVAGSGAGLSNIRQRLEALYGALAWLEVGALHSGGFSASIVVPLATQEET